jgi:hypothetical protein
MKGYCSQLKFDPNTKTTHYPLAHTALRAPGRHSARSKNWPVGSLALSASRAPGRNLGLGRERRFPPGPRLGPVIVSHPSASNGRARNPAEQNRADALALTLALTRSLRSLFRAATSNRPSSSADERPSVRRGNVPEAPS